jgi:hypothetical protein
MSFFNICDNIIGAGLDYDYDPSLFEDADDRMY